MKKIFFTIMFSSLLAIEVFGQDNYQNAMIVTITTPNTQKAAAPIEKTENREIEETKIDDELYKETRFFIGISAGLSKFNVTETDSTPAVILDNEPKDAGVVYGVEAGYYFNENIFVTLNYQHTDLENVYFDDIFATLNYQFPSLGSHSLFFGVLGGYNIMNWENFPVDTVITHENSSSFFVGGQVGDEILITKSISTYIFYRYMKIDNKTKISMAPSTKEIEHDTEQSLNIGLKYNF